MNGKPHHSWIASFFIVVALCELSSELAFRLVSGEFYLGILLLCALFMPRILYWIWGLPFRKPDITISIDPLKPNAAELCKSIREVFRMIYSEGGSYLLYISPLPNTGMRFAFNLCKQRIEAKCGSELYPEDESSYLLPPFRIDSSPVIYRLSAGANEPIDGVYLSISAKRGEEISLSHWRASRIVEWAFDVVMVLLAWAVGIWQIVLGAILLRRIHIADSKGPLWYFIVVASIGIGLWRIYSYAW